MSLETVDVEVESFRETSRLGSDPATGGARKAPAQAKLVDVRNLVHVGHTTDLMGISPDQAADLEPRDFVVFNSPRGPQTSQVFVVARRRDDVNDKDGGDNVYFEIGPAQDKRTVADDLADHNRRAMEYRRQSQHAENQRYQRVARERMRELERFAADLLSGEYASTDRHDDARERIERADLEELKVALLHALDPARTEAETVAS